MSAIFIDRLGFISFFCHRSRIEFARRLIVGFLIVPLLACSQSKTIVWREEVKLVSGDVIVIDRGVTCENVFSGAGSNGCLFQSASLRAVLANSSQETKWEGTIMPLALDISKDGTPYLVTVVVTSSSGEEYQLAPGETHAAFTLNASRQWVRVPVTSVPKEIQPNLIFQSIPEAVEGGEAVEFVNLALKQNINTRGDYPSYFHGW